MSHCPRPSGHCKEVIPWELSDYLHEQPGLAKCVSTTILNSDMKYIARHIGS